MKTLVKLYRLFAALTFGLSCSLAQPGAATQPVASARPDATLIAENSRLEVAPPEAVEQGLRKLAGKTVHGANGEKLGTIRDFVIDKKSGEVVYAVVASGGALGAGTRLRLVPIAALQPAPAGAEGFIIKIDRVGWERGPTLINEAFNAGIIFITQEQQRYLAKVFSPAARASSPSTALTASGRHEPTAPATGNRDAERAASPYVRASDLRDKDLESSGSEIGKVEDVIIDLRRGRALALVELEDDVTGRELEVLIPVDQLDLTNPRRQLTTRLSREDFRRIDPKSSAFATTRARPSTREDSVSPTGRAEPTQGPITSTAATLASAARSARQVLDQHPTLARADITVAVAGNVLYLRGSVATEQLKKQAEATVKQAASGVKLENQLTVPR